MARRLGHLPALEREGSLVGHRDVRRCPEGNFRFPSRGPDSCDTRWFSNQGAGVFGLRGGRGIRLCRPRNHFTARRPNTGQPQPFEQGRTPAVPSTVLHQPGRSATANGAWLGTVSPSRLRGRCRPSPMRGSGPVWTLDEPQPRTPSQDCRWWVWSRPYQREATPCLPIERIRQLSYRTVTNRRT